MGIIKQNSENFGTEKISRILFRISDYRIEFCTDGCLADVSRTVSGSGEKLYKFCFDGNPYRMPVRSACLSLFEIRTCVFLADLSRNRQHRFADRICFVGEIFQKSVP